MLSPRVKVGAIPQDIDTEGCHLHRDFDITLCTQGTIFLNSFFNFFIKLLLIIKYSRIQFLQLQKGKKDVILVHKIKPKKDKHTKYITRENTQFTHTKPVTAYLPVYDCGKVDLSKDYWNPKRKLGVTHFLEIIKQQHF